MPAKLNEVEAFQKLKRYTLPSDFSRILCSCKMEWKYFILNDMDKNGFLFYPIEAVTPVVTEFKGSKMKDSDRIIIFCEYMHRSWWYGFEIIDNDKFIIGIIPDRNSFKPITHSLIEFIELYVSDSSELYDYN